jgi:hypothetical protein
MGQSIRLALAGQGDQLLIAENPFESRCGDPARPLLGDETFRTILDGFSLVAGRAVPADQGRPAADGDEIGRDVRNRDAQLARFMPKRTGGDQDDGVGRASSSNARLKRPHFQVVRRSKAALGRRKIRNPRRQTDIPPVSERPGCEPPAAFVNQPPQRSSYAQAGPFQPHGIDVHAPLNGDKRLAVSRIFMLGF